MIMTKRGDVFLHVSRFYCWDMSRMDLFLMLAKLVSNMNKKARAKSFFVLEGYLNPGSKISMERDNNSDIMCPLQGFNLGTGNVGSYLRSEIEAGRYFWNRTV